MSGTCREGTDDRRQDGAFSPSQMAGRYLSAPGISRHAVPIVAA